MTRRAKLRRRSVRPCVPAHPATAAGPGSRWSTSSTIRRACTSTRCGASATTPTSSASRDCCSSSITATAARFRALDLPYKGTLFGIVGNDRVPSSCTACAAPCCAAPTASHDPGNAGAHRPAGRPHCQHARAKPTAASSSSKPGRPRPDQHRRRRELRAAPPIAQPVPPPRWRRSPRRPRARSSSPARAAPNRFSCPDRAAEHRPCIFPLRNAGSRPRSSRQFARVRFDTRVRLAPGAPRLQQPARRS